MLHGRRKDTPVETDAQLQRGQEYACRPCGLTSTTGRRRDTPCKRTAQLQRGRKKTNLRMDLPERVVEPDNLHPNPSKRGGEHQNPLHLLFFNFIGEYNDSV